MPSQTTRISGSIQRAFHLKGGIIVGVATATPKIYSTIADWLLTEYKVTLPVISTGWRTLVIFLAAAGYYLIRRVMYLDKQQEPLIALLEPFLSEAKSGPNYRQVDPALLKRQNYIHLIVENLSDIQIENCQIHVLAIQKTTAGVVTKATIGKPVELVTAGSHKMSATIYKGVNQHFDLAFTDSETNRLDFVPYASSPHIVGPDFFADNGIHDFKVIVTASGTPPVPETIRVNWEGNWNKLTMKKLNHVAR
jgi:hypothetical protein